MSDDSTARSQRLGAICGFTAYTLWGVFPLYFKALSNAGVSPWQMLAHRVWWSAALLALVVTALGRWKELRTALAQPRTLATLGASTLLIATNWLVFLYAIATEQTLQSSLGYFITPLMNVVLGVSVLGERLRPWQIASVSLAAAGMLVLTVASGQIPWLALLLAVSFACYGLCRKTVAVDSLLGLTAETVLLAPLALGFVLYDLAASPTPPGGTTTWFLLIFSGAATATPLLLFASAARRLRFVTIGFLQYVGPTLQFLIAVAVFREPFSGLTVGAFGLIWLAVALYGVDSLLAWRKLPPLAVAASSLDGSGVELAPVKR